MFSTARQPWQWVTPNPTIPPPALHNARYAGWPHPPVQLPRAASPLPNARHVAFAVDTPSHRPHEISATHTQFYPQVRPRTNSGAQDIMDPVDAQNRNVPNLWTWSADTRAPYLQGAFDMRTTARHDTENAWFRHDNSAGQIIPLNVYETQKAYLHPFLAPPAAPLIYDLRYPPSSLRFPSSSPYSGCGYGLLSVPLTPEQPRQIRLISPDFPWAFEIGPSAGKQGITCLDVLTALHAALQRPLTDTEWGTAGDPKRASLIRARDRRLSIQPVLHGSSNSAARTRPTVRFAPSADTSNHRQELLLLRVDWLGSRVGFVGLVKDEVFARSRQIPGGGEPSETWVVKFQRI
ncbi:hypothetical protein DFH29DRAFT_927701 [Suillus ampliporus]|nr:hypothetical protein DFH29DRAFT_927701 [Suillus ampliporus]